MLYLPLAVHDIVFLLDKCSDVLLMGGGWRGGIGCGWVGGLGGVGGLFSC